MTILRLDLSAGGWRAVPPSLFEDRRLSLDACGVAGYISTRSDSFLLSVSGLCYLLQIGEEKWRRISYELTTAGYLQKTRGRDQRGRFRHELLFSPIPQGGFPKNQPGQSGLTTPKILAQPGAGTPVLEPPPLVNQEGTIKRIDKENEYHHHPSVCGGGEVRGDLNSKLPKHWIDAANFEINIEAQARPIKNRGGLFRSIINRYWATGGPDETIIQGLIYAQKKEVELEAKTKAAHEQARLDRERADLETLRLRDAEAKAKFASCDARKILLLAAQNKVRLKGSERAQSAFCERGEILAGPLRHPLIEILLTS